MAYRRSIISRAKTFYQQQQQQHRQLFGASFPHLHRDDRDREELQKNPILYNPEICNYFQRFSLGTGINFSACHGRRSLHQDRRFALPVGYGQGWHRNFSSGSVGETAAEKIDIIKDVVDVIGDTAAEVTGQAAPVLTELAAATAGTFFPVAALEYLMGYVHIYTGLDWWASIALTTLLIKLIQLPFLIHQLKATTKLTLLRPFLEKLNEEVKSKGMGPEAVAEHRAQSKKLFKEFGVTPFTSLKGILFSGPVFCCFFFAVRTMAERVPSFKEGGPIWFPDLTTPDPMYILPVMTALTFWITIELNAQEGLQGNPTGRIIKNVMRGFAALAVPLTASFPKAIFCYWVTNNLFSLAYGLVMKKPKVKEFLGVPIIPEAPPSATQDSPVSVFDVLKKQIASNQQQSLPLPAEEPLKPAIERTTAAAAAASSSSSNLSHRIKSLEKEVRKRSKKR